MSTKSDTKPEVDEPEAPPSDDHALADELDGHAGQATRGDRSVADAMRRAATRLRERAGRK